MKKTFALLSTIIIIAACQKNAAPAPIAERNLTTARTMDNAASFPFVKIGPDKWMAANLNVNHYRNGDKIPEVQGAAAWAALKTGAWCWYNNDSATAAVYGKLYNWYAVNDPRGLAPEGWHVAADSEWKELSTYLGGNKVSGGALKDTGTTYWLPPNEGATNVKGFTALPGGIRSANGEFADLGLFAFWWTPTNVDTKFSIFRSIYTYEISLERNHQFLANRYSVRCVKDR